MAELLASAADAGQKETLAARIQSILQGYTDTSSVFSEMVQNADDAKATKVCFLLDETTYGTTSDENLDRIFQGPALLVRNSAPFTEEDKVNIRKLGKSKKKDDPFSVGRFGLGFNCVYHLTDVPAFISAGSVMMFDPLFYFCEKEPGKRVDLKQSYESMTVTSKNLLNAFNIPVWSECDPKDFSETVFRLPLRQSVDNDREILNRKTFTYDDLLEVIMNTFKPKAKELLMFLNHVSEIRVLCRSVNDQAPKLLFEVFKTVSNCSDLALFFEGQKESVRAYSNQLKELNNVQDSDDEGEEELEKHFQFDDDLTCSGKISLHMNDFTMIESEDPKERHEEDFLISHRLVRTGEIANFVVKHKSKRFLPLVSAALPLQSIPDYSGIVFCSLPLPVRTGFPGEINGRFEMTPDRRNMILVGSGDGRTKATWNQHLLGAVISVYNDITKIQNLDINNYIPSTAENNDFLEYARKLVCLLNESHQFSECLIVYPELEIEDLILKKLSDMEEQLPNHVKKIFRTDELRFRFISDTLSSFNIEHCSPAYIRSLCIGAHGKSNREWFLAHLNREEAFRFLLFSLQELDGVTYSNSYASLMLPFLPVLGNRIATLDKEVFTLKENQMEIVRPFVNQLNLVDESFIEAHSSDLQRKAIVSRLKVLPDKLLAQIIQNSEMPDDLWLRHMLPYISEDNSDIFKDLSIIPTKSSPPQFLTISERKKVIDVSSLRDIQADLRSAGCFFCKKSFISYAAHLIHPSSRTGALECLKASIDPRRSLPPLNTLFSFFATEECASKFVSLLKTLPMFPFGRNSKCLSLTEKSVFTPSPVHQNFVTDDLICSSTHQTLFLCSLVPELEVSVREFLIRNILPHPQSFQTYDTAVEEILKEPITDGKAWWKNLKFIRSKSGSLHCVSDLLDPYFIRLFPEYDSSKLPIEALTKDKVSLQNLKMMGLQSKPTLQDLEERVRTVSTKQSKEIGCHLLDYLLANLSDEIMESDSIRCLSWIEIHGDFVAPQKIIPTSSATLASRSFVVYDDKDLNNRQRKFLCQGEIKLCHLLRQNHYYQTDTHVGDDLLTSEILNKVAKPVEDFWFWLSDEERFVAASQLCFNSLHLGSPLYFPEIPKKYLKYKASLQLIGVQENYSLDCLVSTLHRITDSILPADDIKLIVNVLQMITSHESYHVKEYQLHVPNVQGKFVLAKDLVYNDMPWLENEPSLSHPEITAMLANNLGLKFRKEQSRKEIIQSFHPGSQFGQQVLSLLAKLKQLLANEYVLGESLFYELLQNADDAKAESVEFLLSDTSFPSESLIDESLTSSMGKSLFCFNDKTFTEEDFEGIQRLEDSVKAKDLTKTGNFGMGWNIVYHITDKPQFVSGEYWVLLDPQGELEGNKLGLKVKISKLIELFPDQIAPFIKTRPSIFNEDQSYCNGTLFRFPLRKAKSKLSSQVVHYPEMLTLLKTFQSNQAYRALLFASNLTNISVFTDAVSSIPQWKIRLESDDSQKEKAIFQKATLATDTISFASETIYKTIQTKLPEETLDLTFQVTVGTSRSPKIQEFILKHPDRKLVPFGSVAVMLRKNLPVSCPPTTICCTFPLNIKLNLPVIINARVLPSKNRRNLVKHEEGETDTAGEWNEILLSEIISPLYNRAISDAQGIRGVSNTLYSLWPWRFEDFDQIFIQHLAKPVLDTLSTKQACILTHNQTWDQFKNVLFCKKEETPLIIQKFLIKTQNQLVLLEKDDKLRDVVSSRNIANVRWVSPDIVLSILNGINISDFSFKPKLCHGILSYVLMDPTAKKIQDLMKMKVFLMLNDCFSALDSMDSHRDKIYFVRPFEHKLLRHIDHRLVDASHDWITDKSITLFKEWTNLVPLTASDLVNELNAISKISEEMLPLIWEYIQQCSEPLNTFKTLAILPVHGKNFETTLIQLHRGAFSAEFFAKHSGIVKILSKLDLLFFTRDPIVSHPNLKELFLKQCKLANVLSDIDPRKVKNLASDEIFRLRTFLVDIYDPQSDTGFQKIIRMLPLFNVYNSADDFACANDVEHLPALSKSLKEILEPAMRRSERRYISCDCNKKISSLCELSGLSFPDTPSAFLLDIATISSKLSPLISSCVSVCQGILHCLSKDSNKRTVELLKKIPFVPDNSARKNRGRACDFLDPQPLIKQIISDEAKFPCTEIDEKYLPSLQALGLQMQIPAECMIQKAEQIATSDGRDYDSSLQCAKAMLTYLENRVSSITYWSELSAIAWLPTSRKNSLSSKSLFCIPKESCTEGSLLCGLKEVATKCPAPLQKQLNICAKPSLAQLNDKMNFILSEGRYSGELEHYMKLLEKMDKLLSTQPKLQQQQPSFMANPWILIEDNVYTCDQIIMESEFQLAGYYHILPKQFRVKCESLLQFADIKPVLEAPMVKSMLMKMMNDKSSSDKIDISVVTHVILYFCDLPKAEIESQLPIPVLTNKNEFFMSNDVSSCDAKWMQDPNLLESVDKQEIHEKLNSSKTLSALNIKTWRHLEISSYEEMGEEFGQEIRLVDRIKEILEAYPEAAVPIEFLQNADDAGAKELTFIFDNDPMEYKQESLISEQMKDLLGSSLMIYNDSTFSDADFTRIIRVGSGGKREDIHNTGQFGIGSVSMYHITDCPMFISGSYFCIFDPLTQYIPGLNKSRPGRRIPLATMFKNFPDQLMPFLSAPGIKEHFYNDKTFKGTIFRLPLRTQKSPISMPMKPFKVVDTLKPITDSAVLLFLKSLHSIRVAIMKGGKVESDVSVVRRIEPLNGGSSFDCITSNSLDDMKEQIAVDYDTTVTISRIDATKKSDSFSKFIVCQSLDSTNSEICSLLTSCSHVVPVGGIAIPFGSTPLNGKIYCTLPLPLTWKVPALINGRFHISSDRRSIPDSSDEHSGLQGKWNELLAKEILPKIYFRAILMFKKQFRGDDIKNYFGILPLVNDSTQKCEEDMVATVWSLLLSSQEQLWPRILPMGGVQWETVGDSIFFDPASSFPEGIHDFLKRSGKNIIYAPKEIAKSLKSESQLIIFMKPGVLWDLIAQSQNGQTEYSVDYIKDMKEASAITKYCFQASGTHPPISILPLLSNQLGKIGHSTCHFLTLEKYYGLIPGHRELFVHPSLQIDPSEENGIETLSVSHILSRLHLIMPQWRNMSMIPSEEVSEPMKNWFALFLEFCHKNAEADLDIPSEYPLIVSQSGNIYSISEAQILLKSKSEDKSVLSTEQRLLEILHIDIVSDKCTPFASMISELSPSNLLNVIHHLKLKEQHILFCLSAPGSSGANVRRTVYQYLCNSDLNNLKGLPDIPIYELTTGKFQNLNKLIKFAPDTLPKEFDIQKISSQSFWEDSQWAFMRHSCERMSAKDFVKLLWEQQYFKTCSCDEYVPLLNYLSLTVNNESASLVDLLAYPWIKSNAGTFEKAEDMIIPDEQVMDVLIDHPHLIPKYASLKYSMLYPGIHLLHPKVTKKTLKMLLSKCLTNPSNKQRKLLCFLGYFGTNNKAAKWIAKSPVFLCSKNNIKSFLPASDILSPNVQSFARSQGYLLDPSFHTVAHIYDSFFKIPDPTMIYKHLDHIVKNPIADITKENLEDLKNIFTCLNTKYCGIRLTSIPQSPFIYVVVGDSVKLVSIKDIFVTESCAPFFYSRNDIHPDFQEITKHLSLHIQPISFANLVEIWRENAKCDTTQKILHPNQHETLLKLFHFLVKHSLSEKPGSLDLSPIKFPDSQWTLRSSDELVFGIDKAVEMMADKLTNRIHPRYLNVPGARQFFSKIGIKQLKGKTDFTISPGWKQRVKYPQSEFARNHLRCINSDNFTSILQLMCPDIDIKQIVEQIGKISIQEVETIELTQQFQGSTKVLEDINRSKFIHTTPEAVYFLFAMKTYTRQLAGMLIKILKLQLPKDTLAAILDRSDDLLSFLKDHELSMNLNDLKLGSQLLAVHLEMLDHSLHIQFRIGEIVAFSQGNLDDYTFVYAKIISKVSGDGILNAFYEIDLGSEVKTVKYEKFFRISTSQSTTSMVIYGGTTDNEESTNKVEEEKKQKHFWTAEEKKAEIRILWAELQKLSPEEQKPKIKRIRFEVHPDKNIGNEENANIVFKWFDNLIQGKDSPSPARKQSDYSNVPRKRNYHYSNFNSVPKQKHYYPTGNWSWFNNNWRSQQKKQREEKEAEEQKRRSSEAQQKRAQLAREMKEEEFALRSLQRIPDSPHFNHLKARISCIICFKALLVALASVEIMVDSNCFMDLYNALPSSHKTQLSNSIAHPDWLALLSATNLCPYNATKKDLDTLIKLVEFFSTWQEI